MRGIRLALPLLLILTSSAARAEEPESPPSMPLYAGLGAFAGGALALSVGTLVLRRDGWQSGDGRSLGYATGAGALSGVALGLTLGLADRHLGDPHRPPYYGFNNLLVGSASLVAGAAVGFLYFSAVSLAEASDKGSMMTKQPDYGRLPPDMAVGAVAGLSLMLVLEAGAFLWGARHPSGATTTVALGAVQSAGGTVWMPTLIGRF